MEPFEEKLSIINKDYAQKTQFPMANHHFPWIPNEQRTEAIPSLLHFLCDNLLFIIFFFPSFQKLHRSLGDNKDFQNLWQNRSNSQIHCCGIPSNLSTGNENCPYPAAKLERVQWALLSRHRDQVTNSTPTTAVTWQITHFLLYKAATQTSFANTFYTSTVMDTFTYCGSKNEGFHKCLETFRVTPGA